MGFLQEKCSFGFYTQQKADQSKPFHCGDDDLDEFFRCDAFTLSNDSIKRIPGSRKKKVEKNIPREKLYSSYPAVMIGRLGIGTDFQSQHPGSDVLSFIKAWFVDPLNKTGCRFLLVDSYNKERNLSFYECNDFNYLFSTEEQEHEFRGIKPERPLNSRLMYFDLIELIRK